MSTDVLHIVRQAARQLLTDIDQLVEGIETEPETGVRVIGRRVADAMDRCLLQLATTELTGRQNRLASGEFWKIAGPVLAVGTLQHRARTKPRGYAGDDVLLRMIHDGACTDHPLGRRFDQYFQSQDAPGALRGRIEIAARSVITHQAAVATERGGDTPYRIASVGSGPASELQLTLERLSPLGRHDIEVVLLDLDPQALDSAGQRLRSLLAETRLRCIRENLFRMPRRTADDSPLPHSDYILCLGLLDYLEDVDATRMLRHLWQQLNPGGEMLVGNFSPKCQARAYMEWVGNWYLIYRTEEQFSELALASGIPKENFVVGAEPLGVNLLMRATKPK